MNDFKFELSRSQQELLLRGLRFVRSSIALEPREYTDGVRNDRHRQYAEIEELEALLQGLPTSEPANV
jgi:hypothetical protein